MIKVALHNLGCKVNSYESELMMQNLSENGYIIVPFEQKADVYIVNTCSVTNIADRKSRQMLHKAKKENPNAVIVAVGCYVQSRGEEKVLEDGVDIVVTNDRKMEIVEILRSYFEGCEYSSEEMCEGYALKECTEHTRAYIKVQDGCNQFCSYCIIPYLRGRIKSRTIKDVVDEITGLANSGYQEVVLTGIHLSSFGLDRPEDEETLVDLIRCVANIDRIQRIRLGSLEPRIVTLEFARAIAGIKKVCPHFHLSLQSGCENTLKRMNRHYTPSEYYEGVKALRTAYEDEGDKPPAITTDVIVGFPGESEKDFMECKDFLEEIKLYETHVFKYSIRQGTNAAKMPDQLTDAIKTDRSRKLLDLNEKNMNDYIDGFVGSVVELLVEETVDIDGRAYQVGYTKEYIRAAFVHEQDLAGCIVSGVLHRSDLVESGRSICIIDDIGV